MSIFLCCDLKGLKEEVTSCLNPSAPHLDLSQRSVQRSAGRIRSPHSALNRIWNKDGAESLMTTSLKLRAGGPADPWQKFLCSSRGTLLQRRVSESSWVGSGWLFNRVSTSARFSSNNQSQWFRTLDCVWLKINPRKSLHFFFSGLFNKRVLNGRWSIRKEPGQTAWWGVGFNVETRMNSRWR